MEILKDSILSYCDMDQTGRKHLNGIDPLAIGANPSNLVSCMNQQNNIDRQNCLGIHEGSGNKQLNEKDASSKSPCRTNTKRSKRPKHNEQNSVTANKTQWRKEKDNKYLNRPYRNYKGVEIKSKEFVDYDCQCSMRCHETLTAEERKLEFEKFWELGSYEAQAIFLVARVDEQVTKKSARRGKKSDSPTMNSNKSKKQFSRTYVLKAKPVCRDMFVKTLGITSKRINTALVKMRAKKLIDLRGVFQGGKNKISEDRYNEVVRHIKKVPRYRCSHTQQMDQHNDHNDFLFQPPLLSMTKMYEQYSKEVENPVSLSMYKKIYYGNFNFKVKGTKREGCSACKSERKMKSVESKKQQEGAKLPVPCSGNQAVHQEFIVPDYVQAGPHVVNCTQTWFPATNFPVPQHNPALHYFDQPFPT